MTADATGGEKPGSTPDHAAVILTALPVEYDAVHSYLADVKEEELPATGTIYEVGRFDSPLGSWKIALVQVDPGNYEAAVEAERAISHLQASVAFFVKMIRPG